MSLSSSAKNKIMRMETYAKFPYLIEITRYYKTNGIENSEILRYANCDTDIVYDSKTYTAGFFKITPPEKTQDSISDAKITISAIDKSWIEKIRKTEKRAIIRFIAVMIYSEDSIESIEPIEDISFELTKAQWDENAIQWTMEFDNLGDINIPCDEINSFNCPQVK